METIKVLKMMLAVQMDDLKDAEMLADYALEAHSLGDEAVYQKMVNRAKTRMQNYESCNADIENQLVKIRAEDSDINTDKLLCETYKEYVTDWKDKVKSKLMSM